MLGDRQQQHVEDHLGQTHQDVLGGVDALARRGLEQEVGQEDQADEHRRVFQAAADGLIGVGGLHEADGQLGGAEPRQGVRRALGRDPARHIGHRPAGREAALGRRLFRRQEAAAIGRMRPVARDGRGGGAGEGHGRDALGPGEGGLALDPERARSAVDLAQGRAEQGEGADLALIDVLGARGRAVHRDAGHQIAGGQRNRIALADADGEVRPGAAGV